MGLGGPIVTTPCEHVTHTGPHQAHHQVSFTTHTQPLLCTPRFFPLFAVGVAASFLVVPRAVGAGWPAGLVPVGRGARPFMGISLTGPCDSQPCRNGGTCVPEGLDRYHCLCPPAFREEANCGTFTRDLQHGPLGRGGVHGPLAHPSPWSS